MEHGTLTGDPVYLKYFDVSDAGFAWPASLREEILERRIALDDTLIFDILLEAGGVARPWTLFPPRAQEDLELVLQAIETSDFDDLKKECLVYYLLKWHKDGREGRFQVDRAIPSQYVNLADAYWHLDSGVDIARAVSLLSDRRLNGDYSSKILEIISLSSNSAPLIIQYVRTAKPHLTSHTDLWTYTHALASTNFLEAWQFQRTFNESLDIRPVLLNNLLDWCISSPSKPEVLKTLLSLPLSYFEETFLRKYALEPPKTLPRTAVPLLRDLVCVRLIQSGKHAEAIKVDHEFAASSFNESKNEAEARRKMVRELYEALPPSERTLLDLELEKFKGKESRHIPNGLPKRQPVRTSPIKDISLSDSWEEIPKPPSLGSINGKTLRNGIPSIPLSTSYGLSSSTNAPPILPTSATASAASRPRPSFPLQAPLSSSLSRQPQFPSIPLSSSGSGSKLPPSIPQTQTLAPSSSFSSSSRRANAFYKPAPVTQQGVKRPFESLALDMDVDGGGEGDADEEMGAEETSQDAHKKDDQPIQTKERTQRPDDAVWEPRELSFSLFNQSPPKPIKKSAPPQPQEALKESYNGRRVPPGAFASDEENEPEEKESTPPPAPRARASARNARTTTESAQREPKRARRSEHPKSRQKQTVPGGLVNSDDEEEEEDHVAPLISPPRRGGTRRVRETTPASDAGDEDGVQTRRRSSRLTSSTGKLPAVAVTGGKAKKTTKTAVKKKR